MSQIQKGIALLNDQGKYQKITVVVFLLIYMELAFMLIGSSFMFMNPTFKCDGIEGNPLEDEACIDISKCTIGS